MIDSSFSFLIFNIITIHKEEIKMEKKNEVKAEVKVAEQSRLERRVERIVVMIDGVLIPFKSKEELREFYRNR